MVNGYEGVRREQDLLVLPAMDSRHNVAAHRTLPSYRFIHRPRSPNTEQSYQYEDQNFSSVSDRICSLVCSRSGCRRGRAQPS